MVQDGKVILLVEDNQDDVELTLMALEGIPVRTRIDVVRDGAEALDYLHGRGKYASAMGRIAGLPSVVLLDLNLPKVDGIGVLRAMRSDPRTKRVPVVILTTSNEEQDMASGYDLGANSYIRKPVDFAKFVAAVKSLSAYWLQLNELPSPSARGVSQ